MLSLFILLTILPTIVWSCAATSSGSSPILACTTCSNLAVITCANTPDQCIGTDQTLTQTSGTNSDGCQTVTVTCTNPTAGSQVVIFWQLSGDDKGTAEGTTTVSRTLVCNANAQLELTNTETGFVGVINQAQCVSP